LRHGLLLEEYRVAAAGLQSHAVPFIVLKGIANSAPHFIAEPLHRPQYDIDLYCPPEFTGRALNALQNAGFRPVRANRSTTDHLPAMIRNQNWTWRGDYYDPDLPRTVELHFRFWDFKTERIPAPGIEKFWQRRITRAVCGIEIPALSLTDSASYCALH